MNRRNIIGGLLALSAGGLMASAHAQVIIKIAPPAPRVEAMPAPRVGYVWIPGAWDWDGRRYVWRTGRWEHGRAGHHWREDRWEQRNGGWVRVRGGWDREPVRHEPPPPPMRHEPPHGHGHDRDHDGVPDRFDSHPNNPYRR
jgi:hypothetical protein